MQPARPFYLTITVVALSLLAFGYYLQFGRGLEPCPLCIFQRLAYMAVGGTALVAAVHGPQTLGSRIYDALLIGFSLTGLGIAGRQVWLQHLPAGQVPSCGPGLDYMLEVFPLGEALRMVFTGSGECAEVAWTFLGLSIAEWSLVCFTAVAVIGTIHLLRRRLFGPF